MHLDQQSMATELGPSTEAATPRHLSFQLRFPILLVSLRAEETPASAQETKAPVVAEAHLVDTYRKFAQPI